MEQLTEKELYEMATAISKRITTVPQKNETSGVTRPTTEHEAQIISIISFSALATRNQTQAENNSEIEMIKDMAETALNEFLPECNTHETIGIPLQRAFDEWEHFVYNENVRSLDNMINLNPHELPLDNFKDIINSEDEKLKGAVITADNRIGVDISKVYAVQFSYTVDDVTSTLDIKHDKADDSISLEWHNRDDNLQTVNFYTSLYDNGSISGFNDMISEFSQNAKFAKDSLNGTEMTVSVQSVRDAYLKFMEEEISRLTFGKNYGSVTPSSYDDKLSASQILNAFNAYCDYIKSASNPEDFRQYLYEAVHDNFIDACNIEEEYLISSIDKAIDTQDDKIYDYYKQRREQLSIGELLEEGGYEGTDIELEDFLNMNYRVNLMFATQAEMNTDMTAAMAMFPFDVNECKCTAAQYDKYMDNAVSYLIHQQGHTVAEVVETFLREDERTEKNFVNTLVDEIIDNTYEMSELTALVTLKGENLLNVLQGIAEGKGNIALPKETTIGLFNEWQGSGSALEVVLEKNAVIPASMVRNVQFEGERYRVHENNGHTVDDVFGGISSNYWKAQPRIISEEPVLIQEPKNEAFSKIESKRVQKAIQNDTPTKNQVDR